MVSVPVLPWREAVRAVVLDPAERVLLVRFETGVWTTPGGGIDPREEPAQALLRELAEEVGLTSVAVGPCLWTRAHAFELPGHCGQRERIYLVRAPAFEPRPQVDPAIEGIDDIRWWTRAELAAAAATATAAFAPTRLPALVAALLDDGPPAHPFDVGI